MKNRSSFTLGALIGGLCGGIIALLFAPKKGKEFRRDISKKYDEATEKALELVESAKEQSDELVEKAQTLVREAKHAAEDMVDKAKRKWKR
jgi:gas vesicle protein